MPATTATYSPIDKDLNEQGELERAARAAEMSGYWKLYDDGFSVMPLKVRAGKANDNVILNLSAQAIDRAVAFFVPEPPRFQYPGGFTRTIGIDGRSVSQISPEQAAIDAFIEAAELDELLVDLALSGFVCGHTFIRLSQPNNTAPIGIDNPPGLSLLDPRMVTVFWSATNIRDVLWYRVSWQHTKELYRRQDIVPDWLYEKKQPDENGQVPAPTKWYIAEYEGKDLAGDKWTLVHEDVWEYPFAPIVDRKNSHAPHQFYGSSDLKRAGMNDAINFVASNTNRIIRFHAHPRTIAKNIDASGLRETSIEGMWEIHGPDADITTIEMRSDLSSSLQFLDTLRAAFFSLMKVVDPATIGDKLSQVTNFAVHILYKDMLDENNSKRSTYGKMLCMVTQNALKMMGFPDAAQPKVLWPDALPMNRLELVQSLEKERQLGVLSQETAAEELGRDMATENERKAMESGNEVESLTAQMERLGKRGLLVPTSEMN